MVAQLANHAIHIFVIRDHRTAIAKTSEVLLNNKARACGVAELTDLEPIPPSRDSWRGFFNHKQAVPLGDFANRFHIRALTVEMDRYQRLRPRRDGRFDLRGIDTRSEQHTSELQSLRH